MAGCRNRTKNVTHHFLTPTVYNTRAYVKTIKHCLFHLQCKSVILQRVRKVRWRRHIYMWVVQVKSKHHAIQWNSILIFSTDLQNSKPCGEISITLDDNNVWIWFEPLTYILYMCHFHFLLRDSSKYVAKKKLIWWTVSQRNSVVKGYGSDAWSSKFKPVPGTNFFLLFSVFYW